jgi:hypothetical protein
VSDLFEIEWPRKNRARNKNSDFQSPFGALCELCGESRVSSNVRLVVDLFCRQNVRQKTEGSETAHAGELGPAN